MLTAPTEKPLSTTELGRLIRAALGEEAAVDRAS
jgi:hypothetical protein